MFNDTRLNRQTFTDDSQAGLTEPALEFEYSLSLSNLEKAENIVSTMELNTYWARQSQRLDWIKKKRFLRNIHGLSSISINFIGFWPGFNIQQNFLINLFRECWPHLKFYTEGNPKHAADINIFSCFPDNSRAVQPSMINILYLGENVKPYYDLYDVTLSCHKDTFCDRNVYIPLWLTRIRDFVGVDSVEGEMYSVKDLSTDQLSPRFKNRYNSICYIGSNNEPTRRCTILNLKRSGYTVVEFGGIKRPIISKYEVLRDYLFNLCLENSSSPGYVTEKLLDSFVSGAIPIYHGILDDGVFNRFWIYFASQIPFDSRLLPLTIGKIQNLASRGYFDLFPGLLNERGYRFLVLSIRQKIKERLAFLNYL
jgi:hypothetical protein